jgi:hypothetical protein
MRDGRFARACLNGVMQIRWFRPEQIIAKAMTWQRRTRDLLHIVASFQWKHAVTLQLPLHEHHCLLRLG